MSKSNTKIKQNLSELNQIESDSNNKRDYSQSTTKSANNNSGLSDSDTKNNKENIESNVEQNLNLLALDNQPSTNDRNNKTTTSGTSPRNLYMEMSEEEFQELVNSINDNKIIDFIKKYQELHQSLTNDDVISLGLMQAIKMHEVMLPNGLLYAKDNFINPESLVVLDKNGNNVIYYALKHSIGIEDLSDYLFALENNYKINCKYIMSEDLMQKIAEVMWHPSFESHPRTLINELILPLYA